MDLGLQGKVAIVPASSKGIGRAIAQGLAAEGVKLVMCSRDEALITAVADAIRSETGTDVVAFAGDVTAPGTNERLVEMALTRFGGIDILVNNAGGPPPGRALEFGDEDWERAFQLTFMSALRLIRLVVPHMRNRGGGRILNVVSTSVKVPIENLDLSNAIRPGTIGLAKTLSIELAKDNILINNVCPGAILTDRIRQTARATAERTGRTLDQVLAENASRIPVGRIGTPEEFANVVVFLASERASYVTGATLCVDGGSTRSVY